MGTQLTQKPLADWRVRMSVGRLINRGRSEPTPGGDGGQPGGDHASFRGWMDLGMV